MCCEWLLRQNSNHTKRTIQYCGNYVIRTSTIIQLKYCENCYENVMYDLLFAVHVFWVRAIHYFPPLHYAQTGDIRFFRCCAKKFSIQFSQAMPIYFIHPLTTNPHDMNSKNKIWIIFYAIFGSIVWICFHATNNYFLSSCIVAFAFLDVAVFQLDWWEPNFLLSISIALWINTFSIEIPYDRS